MVGCMFFDRRAYLIFLPLVVLVYWRLARRNKTSFLLAPAISSTAGGTGRFLFLIATSTVVRLFYCARFIAGRQVRGAAPGAAHHLSAAEFRFSGIFSNTSTSSSTSAEHVLHALGM